MLILTTLIIELVQKKKYKKGKRSTDLIFFKLHDGKKKHSKLYSISLLFSVIINELS